MLATDFYIQFPFSLLQTDSDFLQRKNVSRNEVMKCIAQALKLTRDPT